MLLVVSCTNLKICIVALLYLININNEAATDRRTLQITSFQWQLVFKNWQFVLPDDDDDDTVVPKHDGVIFLILH